VLEGLWQAAWFLLSLALYIEAGRTPNSGQLQPVVAPQFRQL
jgi:hypothetical protein